MIKKKHFLLGVIIVLMAPLVFSIQLPSNSRPFATYSGQSTLVSGYISENTTWTLAGSPYVLVGDAIVEPDVFLTIEPGVVVKFASGANLVIDGGLIERAGLIAHGNSTHKITFTSNATTPAPGDWGGIKTMNGGHQEVSWSTIEYSNNGLHGNCEVLQCSFDKNNAGISGSNIDVANSNFTRNDVGVSGSNAKITLCTFEENGQGVDVAEEGAAVLSHSAFYNNTNAIYLRWRSYVRILGCRVTQNKATGISCEPSVGGSIENTNVTYNSGDGIAQFGGDIRNCSISNNNGNGVSAASIYDSTVSNNGGFGVQFGKTMSNCRVSNNSGIGVIALGSPVWGESTVEYSEISGNLFGIEVPSHREGTDLTVSHSYIHNNLESGIVAFIPSSAQYAGRASLRVKNSIVDSNGKFGIRMNVTVQYPYPWEAILDIPEIINSVISNHSIGALGKFGVVSGSAIKSNCQIGLSVVSVPDSICWNNIYDNGYNIENDIAFGKDVNATHNWWGTTNETSIEEHIYDHYDDANLSRVWYKPYLSSPVEIDTIPPNIGSISRAPNTPSYDEDVVVSADITDNVEVDQAFLSYTLNSSWYNVSMNRFDDAFSATIPAQPSGTLVQYRIKAKDTRGNWAESNTHSYIVGERARNKFELLAPYIGLTIILAVAIVTVVYVKKRKRHTEIIS